MLFRKSVLTTGLLALLLTVSACATKPKEVAQPETPTPVYDPAPVDNTPVGPVPGSQADLEQNVGNLVYFGYDQYNLSTEAQATLGRQAAFLKEYPETRLRVAGNCDERGTREYNLALGARRANAVRSYLVSLGVDGSRITTVSYGKERPIDAGSNETAWSKNRNGMSTLVSVGS